MPAPLSPPPPPSGLWQWVYQKAHGLRFDWYRDRARRLSAPVVSVGNLHWGGGGKTPLTAAVAAHLRDNGRRVAILSRGYRSRGHGIRLASIGDGPRLPTEQIGDEPALLARELPGVAVIVGPDRHSAGVFANTRLALPPDIFLLDDGFSHLALHRDLDLLAFPAADPFAGGRLPPSGRLREPLASAVRAQAALLTGDATPEAAHELGKILEIHGFRGEAFACPTRPQGPYLLDSGQPLPREAAVLLVSAIARPAGFRAVAASLGYDLRGEIAFADHDSYPESGLARIRSEFRASRAAAVLTTAKDIVKLEGRLDLPIAVLPIRAEPEPRFWTWLDTQLAAIERRDRPATP